FVDFAFLRFGFACHVPHEEEMHDLAVLDVAAIEPVADVGQFRDDGSLHGGLLADLADGSLFDGLVSLDVTLRQRPDARRVASDEQPRIRAVLPLEHEPACGALVFDPRRPARPRRDYFAPVQRSPMPLLASRPTCASSTLRTCVCNGSSCMDAGSSWACFTSARSVSTNASSVSLVSVSVGSIM